MIVNRFEQTQTVMYTDILLISFTWDQCVGRTGGEKTQENNGSGPALLKLNCQQHCNTN